MKITNEKTVREYHFTNQELVKGLQIKGKVQGIKWENDQLIVQTLEDRSPRENPVSEFIGNLNIGKS